ncbi:hypothetical protein IFM89_014215 [Coptis chinensis]|uniref:Uncharacterized protein n=1 Tax=Coptis chinensis TaxID=261450 RepID=A0A835ITH8_9MAGN|nr:hypothetical protein IFM89_014215 [Coptis chinensis]
MGDLDFFKGVASDVLLNSITEGSADSVLDIVAKENHLGCCEEICKKCPSLLYRLNYNGDTPLHHAAWHGDPKMVKFFISADTKMDFKNEEDIESQGGEIVPNKKLLMMKNRQGNTALHHAVKKRHHEAAMIMIEADPDNKLLIMSNNNNQTALDLAVESKYFRILRIVFGKVPYMANDLKKKAFNLIATCDNLAMVELLIEADPDKKLLRMVDDSNKDSALHWAVRYQNIKILSMLIKADPDKMLVRVVNEDKDTALHLAVRLASVGAVKLLIEADPDLEYCPNNSGETPLLIAVNEDMTASATFHMLSEIRKLLLKAQPSQCKARIDDRGWTLLHLATRKGNLRAIDDIIQISPDCVHLVDIEGQNFLHFAAKYELVKVMMHVLGSKEIPDSVLNGKDKKGNTPLHTAALNGTESVVLCLLYYPKVDKTTVNGKGQHVLDAVSN